MTTYLFPGQGSQSKGMGGTLFSEFQEYVDCANDILGYFIQTLCLEDPKNQLNQTNFTQPAIYVVNALSYFKKLRETSIKPDYVAGHSLGEYNALLAANVFDFETGLRLVQKRGQLMSQASEGAMLVIAGLRSEEIEDILKENNLSQLSIANYNTFTQVVISGSKEAILLSEPIFIDHKAICIPLKVSGAFHSPYMNQAQEEFSKFLSQYTFSPQKIPVIANLTAKPYVDHEIASMLPNQINHSVRWLQSIEYLIDHGEKVFDEIGPGKVLTGLCARIQKGQ